ncbi:MAG TPA: ABC transporter ATP-binding protein [Polyangiaceae bacterium]|nr:ABC transporter ATP-binding protein [Polyangiaceae bacterium]
MNSSTLPNRLWPFSVHFYRQFPWGCLGLVVFPILSRGAFASIAYATKRLTDTVLAMHQPAAETGKLVRPFVFFVALVVARFAIDAGAWFSSYHTRSPMLRRIKEEVFAYTQRLSSSYFENTLSGKIAHRAIMLPEQVLQLFDMVVFDFIPSTAFFAFVAVFFHLASPSFFAAAVVAIITYFSVSLLVGRECTRRAIASNEAKAAVTGRIVDVLTNIRNVFFFANQTLEDEQLEQYTGAEFERRRASYRAVVRLRSVQYVMDISMWIVFVGGALHAWVHGRIGAGDFVMMTALTSSLLQTAYNLGQRIPEFYDLVGSARESIDTLIVPATVTDIPGALTLRVTHGAIDLDRIAFAYEVSSVDLQQRSRNVVKDFELSIPAGQRVGLVGPSGAGKTTLMGLLLRMHDVAEGAIRIDGQDIREITQQSLRQSIALIPQDTTLFHRNLLENIRYGRPGASDEEVELAARRAHAHEFIMEQEHGYRTMVGERGVKLSGGQRQRIAIARAILKNAPVLLLDEATSALDSQSEQIIQSAMREAMAGKTVIAIAHRLSTVMDMDRLIVLDRGAIVADGSHADLLRRGGLYAELWRKQSGDFNPVARRVEVLDPALELGDLGDPATSAERSAE